MKSPGAELLASSFLYDYKKYKKQFFKVFSIHRRGYNWNDWHVCGLTEENRKRFLSTAQYYAMHPLNEQRTYWIDDKLTIKYLCAGTPLDRLMPKYFYQIDASGTVLALPDAPAFDTASRSCSAIVDLLEAVGELALKRVAGSLGEGFYKAEYRDSRYYLNGEAHSRDTLEKKLGTLRDYLITEYLHPHKDMVPFSADTVNTLRYLVGRTDSGMILLKSYIRFGTKASGFVENYGAGGVLCYVSGDGTFSCGNILDFGTMRNTVIRAHPDTGIDLKGQIPLWKDIEKAADDFCRYFPQLDYLGLDFVITDKNEVKILEINSLTSLDGFQMDGPIFDRPEGEFCRKRLRTM